MKVKNYFVILLLSMLLICCAGAISAASDDNVDINGLNQIAEDDSVSTIENNEKPVSVSQDETILKDTSQDTRSPYDQFVKDLNDNTGTVYLNGNIKISEPFKTIKHKTVIDGKGHTIDAQHKTYIFKISAPVTLKNIILKNGKSDNGGALYANAALTLNNCQFINNVATKAGGAIFVKGTLNIDNSKFINNKATDSGGAIANTYGKSTIKNSAFEMNSVSSSKSTGYGGAIWFHKSSSSVSKSTFKSNTCLSKVLKSHKKATKYKFNGGAIAYSSGSTHSLNDCKFSGNKASNHGGSLFVYKCKSLKINKCDFTKNRAVYEDGGAMSFTANKLTVTNSNFKKNLAYEDGGAFDSYSLTGKKIRITVKNTKFDSNTAYKCGGAIWMGVKTVYNIANSKFIKNKASSAGALEAEDGSAKITKCTFTSNKAAKVTSWVVKTKSGGRLSHSGGAILVKNHCKIFKCTFKKNKATYGKVVKNEGGKVTAKGNKGYKLN